MKKKPKTGKGMDRGVFLKRLIALTICSLVTKPMLKALSEPQWITFTTSNGNPGKYRVIGKVVEVAIKSITPDKYEYPEKITFDEHVRIINVGDNPFTVEPMVRQTITFEID